MFNGNEKEFLNCLLYPDKLGGYAPYPYDYNVLENYSELKTRLFERKNNLNQPALIANNLDTFLEIMTKIELVDTEVEWQSSYRKIIDFSHIEMNSPQYNEWENKKIKVKNLGGFDIAFDTKLKPIIEKIEKYEFKNLDREGKKNYLLNLKKSQIVVIECMNQVLKLQNAYGTDMQKKKKSDNPFEQTSHFTYALFKETLSEPMHMNLPDYDNKNFNIHFKNGNENVYIRDWLLIQIFGNLESRRDCIGNLIHELLKAFNLPSFEYVLPLNEQPEAPTPPATGGVKQKTIKEKPVISFKAMFINPSEYDKVLGYISEYLNDTNQWTGSIIYLSAFYGVLRDRGYLNKIYTAPQINSTLKNEFSIDAKTTDKNFQSDKINNAVATYAEAFNMIPSLKSTK